MTTREHIARALAHGEAERERQLAEDLAETAEWQLVQLAAVAGLRAQIADKLTAISEARARGESIDALEGQLEQLRRAADRARDWNPLRGGPEIPTRRTP